MHTFKYNRMSLHCMTSILIISAFPKNKKDASIALSIEMIISSL